MTDDDTEDLWLSIKLYCAIYRLRPDFEIEMENSDAGFFSVILSWSFLLLAANTQYPVNTQQATS